MSVHPGGMYIELPSFLHRKLCRTTHDSTMSSTFSGAKLIGNINTLNRLAKMPNTFSDTLLARLNRSLKILCSRVYFFFRIRLLDYVFSGNASSATITYGATLPEPGSGAGAGTLMVLFSRAL